MSEINKPVHGTALAIAVDPDGPLAGALLTGSSGSGKSALALSAIEDCPWRRTALIADDAVLMRRDGAAIIAEAPARIEGLIEIRGFGPAPCRTVKAARLAAVFALTGDPARLPEPDNKDFGGGMTLPVWPFRPDGGDASVRLRLTLRAILSGQTP